MTDRDINSYRLSSGRMLKEDGGVLNQADYIRAQRLANVEQQSRDGTLHRSWWSGSIPASTTYYFAIQIPAGLDLFGVFREVVVESGSVRASFAVGGAISGTTGEAQGPYNFNNVDGPDAVSSFDRVTLVDPGALELQTAPRLLAAPTGGSVRQPSAQTAAGAHVKHDASIFPFFVLQNILGNQLAECQITVFWQELPKP